MSSKTGTKKQTHKASSQQSPEHDRQEAPVAAKGTRDGMPARRTQTTTEPPAPDATSPDDASELVVFAFRLSRAERDLIHAAAGSAKASKFVRGLAIAAARGDRDEVLGIVDSVQAQ